MSEEMDAFMTFCDETFGTDLPSRFKKLSEETGELAEAIMCKSKHDALEEMADCGIILMHMAHLRGEDLFQLMLSKSRIVVQRMYKSHKAA